MKMNIPEKCVSKTLLGENEARIKIGGIILAGGEAKRYGFPKQLLIWKGVPFVRSVAITAISSGIDTLILVTGAYHEQVSQAVVDLPLQIVLNTDWDRGQSTSLAKGISSLPKEIQAVVVFLVDMPQVSRELIRALIARYIETRAPIVAPWIGTRRSNPVLFDRSVFPALSTVEGDGGGRILFSRYSVDDVVWDDPLLLLDVDTEEDYRRLLDTQKNLDE